MDDDIAALIDQAVRQIMLAEGAAIEQACEAALQGGEHGVLVVRDQHGYLVGAEVSPLVPYGVIHHWTAAGLADKEQP